MLIKLKKLWKDIKGYYGVLYCVGYLRKYNPIWDQELNELLDADILVESNKLSYTFKHPDTAALVEVWVANFPYAYGHSLEEAVEYRPSLKTMKRLRQYQEKVGVIDDE